MIDNGGILTVKDLHTHFFSKAGVVKAVNGVNLELRQGSVLGLVGESGSGKTTIALSILQLVSYPGRIVKGEVLYKGRNMLTIDKEELRKIRGKDISIVFQDPTHSLNPVIPVGNQIEEMLMTHLEISNRKARERAIHSLAMVGMPDPERIINQYPFQLSGGMAQRVMLAIALSLNPKVLIADEPTSNLDVTLQAQILNQLRALKENTNASILLITHDLGVVAQMADQMAVMYAGSIVEYGDKMTLFTRPAHPYTWALLQAVPRLDVPNKPVVPLRGTPPSLLELQDECAFIPRCNKAMSVCRTSARPPLVEIEPNHFVACYNPVRHDWD